ncbi:MAG: hypothetical protein H6899_04560 [Rhodobacter sp.]|nr:hypothetical protein [Rhodobacter sp.]
MRLSNTMFRFFHDENGAVTVDWVVLSAATVGLGIASAAAVRTGTGTLGDSIQTSLSGAEVAALGDLSGAPEPYVSLYYTAAQMEAYHTRYTDGSYSQDWLTNQYNFYMARSATQLASSTPSSAAISIDAAYVYREALIGIGGTVPSGTTTVEDLHSQYGQLT